MGPLFATVSRASNRRSSLYYSDRTAGEQGGRMCKMGRAAAPGLATNVVLGNLAKIVSCSLPGNGAVKGDPLQTMVGAHSGAFD